MFDVHTSLLMSVTVFKALRVRHDSSISNEARRAEAKSERRSAILSNFRNDWIVPSNSAEEGEGAFDVAGPSVWNRHSVYVITIELFRDLHTKDISFR